MTPCKFFAQGRCTYGASCKNTHEAAAESEAWRRPPTLQGAQSTKKLTETKRTSSESASSQITTPCWFFSQGKCTYGAACRQSHEATPSDITLQPVRPKESETLIGIYLGNELAGTSPLTFVPGTRQHGSNVAPLPKLKADAPAFTPSTQIIPGQPEFIKAAEASVCIFYSKGFCRNGVNCPFRHESPASRPSHTHFENMGLETSNLSKDISQLSIATFFSQEFNGASVTFEAGAEVSSVKLSSDFSTIQISGLSPDARASFITGLLSGLGFQVPASHVLVKCLGEEGSVAEVKVEDSTFAKLVTRKFESQQGKVAKSKISIKPMGGSAATGALANRLQLSTVTCTWYKPSRIAWLVYRSYTDARNAKQVLESRKILERSLECSVQPGGRSLHFTLQVGNLNSRTQKRDLEAVLTGQLHPDKITLGEPSYPLSDTRASEIVESLLRSKGGLESFQWHVLPGNSKIKATATFSDRDEAAETVRSLNNLTLRRLGGTKLFVSHVISVKYNVPIAIMDAISSGIDQLRESIWQTGHIHLKSYPQTDPAKPIIAIRVFGESIKHVAEAKTAMEKMLAGTVVMNGDSTLWDPYFLNAKSLAYLNELSREHKLYLHRDARKCRLLIYGGLPDARAEVERLLLAKTREFQQHTHTIILTPELLTRAMQGGMKKLKGRFGPAVTLNVSANPKTIAIAGSLGDVQEARAMLLEKFPTTKKTEDCVVCWTEATDALHTQCGHVYCKDCFANQASSAGDSDIPLRCYGNGGKCLQVFSINELKRMLSHFAFEELLEASFDSYIRRHPKDFQHCPTPDCPQVYRITATGERFLCSTCLESICTSCNVVAHDGMTCEEYKDSTSEGTKAFQKWKKEHDVRDCPNCKAAIEKSFGCNHMECKQCSAHICWFCMETFRASAECYAHMTKAHGNYFED